VVLGLFGWDDLADDAGLATSHGPGFRGQSLAHNEPFPNDVDRVFQEFLEAGATVVKHPGRTPWGVIRVMWLNSTDTCGKLLTTRCRIGRDGIWIAKFQATERIRRSCLLGDKQLV